MSSLDRRKIKILEAIVHDYVTTTKPGRFGTSHRNLSDRLQIRYRAK